MILQGTEPRIVARIRLDNCPRWMQQILTDEYGEEFGWQTMEDEVTFRQRTKDSREAYQREKDTAWEAFKNKMRIV